MNMPETTIFEPPRGLQLVKHFTISSVLTWGTKSDSEFKKQVRNTAQITSVEHEIFEWYVFSIRALIGLSRRRKIGPDIENVPKLIVDAFTGVLYPDDNLDNVRGVQVEGEWVPDDQQCTEVWIWGMPRE